MRRFVVIAILLAASAAEAKPTKSHHHGHPPARAAHSAGRALHTRAIAAPAEALRGQSIGVPWAGVLHDAARLPEGDGYVIRRPWRAFGTKTTVDIVSRVVGDVRDEFPDAHVLAIGDISAEHGGAITQHRSHQSGRDIDIGLFYREKPANYPRDFVRATADNLDCAATFALVDHFARAQRVDGGPQIIFLDFDVQGLLYTWAKDHGVDEDRLARIFQYPHGRGSSEGLVRHYPGHDNHMHVRFRCRDADTSCR
jgi:murein endopeptidase